MENQSLLNAQQSSSEIELVYYPGNNTMPAKDLGEAIIGWEVCLKELAKYGQFYYEGIYVEPIEYGSLKTRFRYIKKHPWAVLVATDLVVNLFNNSFSLIEKFGANSFKNPTANILEEVSSKAVLELCRSFNFRDGLQKIAMPLNEDNNKVHLIINDKTLQITCDNKYQFYVDKQEEPILPELINGEETVIEGEITRINKVINDLGFYYKGYTLNVSPIDKDKDNTKKFHEYLEFDKVILRGIVIRNTEYEVPKIKVINIISSDSAQQKLSLEIR